MKIFSKCQLDSWQIRQKAQGFSPQVWKPCCSLIRKNYGVIILTCKSAHNCGVLGLGLYFVHNSFFMWWRSRVWTVCIGFVLFLAVFCCPGNVIFFFDFFFWLYTWSALLLEKLLHVLSAGLLCIPMTSVFLNLLSKLPLKDCVFYGASCMKGVRWVYYLHQKCII